MMGRIIKTTLTVLAIMLCCMAVYAAASAGSSDDPVVTKSYVDKTVADKIDKALSDYEKEHDKSSSNNSNSNNSNSAGGSYSFEVVHMKAGKKLICGEGTELVVRSGKAAAIDNGSDGVSDITSGKDLMSGETAAPNHLLLVPRDDGRGIAASTDAYIMVKGEYKIV